MNVSALIAKIENDVAAHARFDKKLVGLTVAALIMGVTLGTVLSATAPFAIYVMTLETTALSLALVLLAYVCVANILAFKTALSARYGYGVVFLVELGFCKWAVYQFAPHHLLNNAISFNSLGHNLSCFFLGFGPSALIMSASLVTHWKMQMAPSHRVRVVTAVVSACAGLIAQTMYCPYLNVSHLLAAHIGQVIAIWAIVGFLDHYLVRIWFLNDRDRA